MFDFLNKLIGKKKDSISFTREELAEYLKTTPDALAAFEASYQSQILDAGYQTDNLMDHGITDEKRGMAELQSAAPELDVLINRIVNELLSQTAGFRWDGKNIAHLSFNGRIPESTDCVTPDDLAFLPKELRPQLTGHYMKKDINDETCRTLLYNYRQWQKTGDIQWYHMFRRGLDILDLDPVTYAVLGCNQAAMGYWLPPLAEAVSKQDFFKIPATTVIKVPLTLLQLTRTDELSSLTPSTVQILDRFCTQAFDLNTDGDYFVKTGTFSSKFDFRNALVHDPKEIRELGEYLFFLSSQAVQMASPLTNPCIYGVSTTNEWVVRDYIKDTESNPCIYKGLPLHTEYRFFVDFDSDKIIGAAPYWEPETMKQRFGHEDDADSPHNLHDYMIYLAHEETLMDRYNTNVGMLREKLEKLIPDVNLAGQWSLDVMQNGNDFWLIDMALAADSAFNDCVPKELRGNWDIKQIQTWIPEIA